MEPPASSPARAREEEAEIDFEEEEEDPELLEPWSTSSDDSEPEQEPKRPKLEPPVPPPPLNPSPGLAWTEECEEEEDEEERPKLDPPPPLNPSPALVCAEPPEQQTDPTTAAEAAEKKGVREESEDAMPRRWPGWPGVSVFRLVVPADKVGGVIGRRGETINRLCEETRARVRVLGTQRRAACRIILVSAKEEIEAEVSPAMNAAIKIFKHINEIEEINSDGTLSASTPEICCARLLVPFAQSVHLIGKRGVTIKAIQESTGTTIRIIDEDELLSHDTVDERIVEICGASLKVLNALKSVLQLLRKFLVDPGVLHLFERKNQEVVQPQDTTTTKLVSPKQVGDFSESDQRNHGNPISSRLPYGHDPSFCGPHSPYIRHATDSLMIQRSPGNQKGSRFLYGRDPSFHDPYSRDLSQPTTTTTKPVSPKQVGDFSESDQRNHGNPISSRLPYGHDPSFCGPHSPYIHHGTDSLMIQRSPGNQKGSRFLYGRDPSFHDPYSRDLSQPTDSLITKITQTMQVPMAYAEEIIGVRGKNIELIRSVSGAVVVLEEIGDYQEVQVIIEGTPSQVQTAHQLVQEVISGDRAPPYRSSYHNGEGADPGLLNYSPYAGSRFAHSPRAIATNRDYLPYEEQTPHGHWRNPTHCVRGYRQ